MEMSKADMLAQQDGELQRKPRDAALLPGWLPLPLPSAFLSHSALSNQSDLLQTKF